MEQTRSDRGFQYIMETGYPPQPDWAPRVVCQSSAIGNYPDSFDKPGSSYLWIGENHHLNREQVAELATALQLWLSTGKLF